MTSEIDAAADVGGSPASVAAEGPFGPVRQALELHGEELAGYPGVISVRPGYRFRDGRMTAEPVVSVAVLHKQEESGLATGDRLPRRVGDVPVDVVPAGAVEQVRAAVQTAPPTATAAVGALAELAAGRGVVDLRTPLEAEAAEIPGFVPPAPRDEYPEPRRLPETVEEEMTLVCHAGPDSGWRLLREFLAGTERTLTATMFEFTARHILDALVQALPAPRTLRFVMDFEREDHGLDNPQVLQELSAALGGRLDFAWAPVAFDNVTTVGYFPSSYHIKVAVRDGASVWLSSGNWKPSSQPETDPFAPPAGFDGRRFQRGHNREWHVIAHSPRLAEQFEFFIGHDLEVAREVQADAVPPSAPAPRPDVFVAEGQDVALEPAPAAKFFPELVLNRKLRVQPLLTPRHFAEHVLPLIQGAKRRVWFQNQSLKPDPSRPEYMRLFHALRDRSNEAELDVRIIARGDFGPHTVLMALRQAGFDMARVRLQNGCHTKGLIIDDDIVVVGSHNWTGQGALENRDASLFIHDAEAVKYYAQLLEHDWSHLASDRVDTPPVAAMLATPGAPTPAGMRRVSWAELAE